jgi:hypothetical protein
MSQGHNINMSHVQRMSSGETYFEIGKKKHVTMRFFKDQPLIDIQEHYGANCEEKPGKKGISLTVEQARSRVVFY